MAHSRYRVVYVTKDDGGIGLATVNVTRRTTTSGIQRADCG